MFQRRNLLAALLCGTALAAAAPNCALALEDVPPFLTGTTIGVPVGELPPVGLYFATQPLLLSFNVKNDSGQNIGVHIDDLVISNQMLWVPQIPSILGATYGAFIVQPIRFSRLSAFGSVNSDFGVVNTVLSPVNLSWNFHNGFAVSLGAEFYVPDSAYYLNDPIHIGRNYFTFEPSLGLSYVKNGFDFTVHPVVDFNGTNGANGYHSGTVLSMDYTATYRISKLTFGVGGTVVDQFANDTQDGVAVAAIPGIHGFGNKAKNVTVGPYLGYNFEPFNVAFYYTRSVYARDTAAGDQFFLTVSLPLTSSHPKTAERQNSAGPRE